MEKSTVVYVPDATLPTEDRVPSLWVDSQWYGTPDLHPEGYDVVTDLLIGISLSNCDLDSLAGETCELDIMLIAEPKKITSKDMTQMLTQAQDL